MPGLSALLACVTTADGVRWIGKRALTSQSQFCASHWNGEHTGGTYGALDWSRKNNGDVSTAGSSR